MMGSDDIADPTRSAVTRSEASADPTGPHVTRPDDRAPSTQGTVTRPDVRTGSSQGTVTHSDDRAVSIAITHALTVAITTVLISGLLISSGTLLESQEQRVGDQQLSEIGSDVVSYVHEFDHQSQSGTEVRTTVSPDYPDRIVESYSYTIALRETPGGNAVVELSANRLDQSVRYEIRTDAAIRESSTTGGEVRISLCANPQEITLGGCES